MLTASRLAPAKINFALRVLGRRQDGYHELDTLMLPLELADLVELEVELDAAATQVRCQCPGHPELESDSNLAASAARLYLARAGRRASVRISIQKRIWVAAGLGGGSSDAAAVLELLDQLLGLLPRSTVRELAGALGADVPFFLLGQPARARGRGDELQPLAPLPPLTLILLNPGTPLPTAEVYRAIGLSWGQQTGARPLELGQLPEGLLELAENQLQPAAERLCPRIIELCRILRDAGAAVACMTGSGPTVFGVFEAAAARAAADKLGNMPGFFAQLTATASA